MTDRRRSFVVSGLAVIAVVEVLTTGSADAQRRRVATGSAGGRMGDYEVVDELARAPARYRSLARTAGRGDRAAVSGPRPRTRCGCRQRGEIELPPGAKPWTFAVSAHAATHEHRPTALFRQRIRATRCGGITSSSPSTARAKRSRSGCSTTSTSRRRGGSGLGEVVARAAQAPDQSLRSREAPLDRRRRHARDQRLHQRRQAGEDDGRARRTGPRAEQLQPPTDIAWLPDGTFFVADGYAGHARRKVRQGREVPVDWGRPPNNPDNPGPNEFCSVHSIGISRDRRLFVADREHHRMQVFDENGKFLEMWPTGHNSAVLTHIVTEDDYVWVADWTTDRLVKYDLDGHYILDIGGPGAQPGQFDGVHQIHVDQERNLYVTEVSNDRSQKFRPRKDADPAQLIKPMVGARTNW